MPLLTIRALPKTSPDATIQARSNIAQALWFRVVDEGTELERETDEPMTEEPPRKKRRVDNN